MTFPYLLETKIPHKEAVIPFLGFPAFNKKKKKKEKSIKLSFVLKFIKNS